MTEFTHYRAPAREIQDPPLKRGSKRPPIELGGEEPAKEKIRGVVTLGEYEGALDERKQAKQKEFKIIESDFKMSSPQDLFNFITKAQEVMSKDQDIQEFPELKDRYYNLMGKAMNELGTKNMLEFTTKAILNLRKENLPPQQNFAARENIINYIEAMIFLAQKAKSNEKIQKFIEDLDTLKKSLYQ
jgi:hypothetical protein